MPEFGLYPCCGCCAEDCDGSTHDSPCDSPCDSGCNDEPGGPTSAWEHHRHGT